MEYTNVFLILLFIGIILYVFFDGSAKSLRNQGFPLETVLARLSDKRIEVFQNRRLGLNKIAQREVYYLTFTKEDGISHEFVVTRQDFYDFEIGTSGKMTHQGTRYDGFESDSN
jgi:hypothetical protein